MRVENKYLPRSFAGSFSWAPKYCCFIFVFFSPHINLYALVTKRKNYAHAMFILTTPHPKLYSFFHAVTMFLGYFTSQLRFCIRLSTLSLTHTSSKFVFILHTVSIMAYSAAFTQFIFVLSFFSLSFLSYLTTNDESKF
jgi:hypothetical protein